MTLSAEDRLDILELFARYAWALDTGDSAGVAANFVDGATVKVRETERTMTFTDVPAWINNFHQSLEGFRGRQHHMSQFLIEELGEGRARVRAYWLITKTETVTSTARLIHNNGYYNNTVVKTDGGWRFAEVQIRSWNDRDLPWVGPVLPPGVAAYEAMAAKRAVED